MRRAWIVITLLMFAALACNLNEQAPPSDVGSAVSVTPLVLPTVTPEDTQSAVMVDPSATLPPAQPPTPLPPTAVPPTAVAAVACDVVIQHAINRIDEVCAGTGRNQACYGHDQVIAWLQPGASGIFQNPSDLINLVDLSRLDTGPYNPDGDQWGIVLLRVQADLPDTLPGQAITFIAYGSATIEDAGGPMPMQTVYINTGLGDPTCSTAPEAGVLIQNDSGAIANLTVNGVDLAIGSTVLVQAQPNREMVLSVLEGRVDALALGQRAIAAAGAEIRVQLGAGLRLLEPSLPPRLAALDAARLQAQSIAPLLQALPSRITIPQPLSNLELNLPPLIATRLPQIATVRPVTLPPVIVPTLPPAIVVPTLPPTIVVPTLPPTAVRPTAVPPAIVIPTLPPINVVPPRVTLTPTRTPSITPTPFSLQFNPNLNLPVVPLLPTATPIIVR